MSEIPLIVTEPDAPIADIILAHGSGVAADSAPMTAYAEALASAGLRVFRFDFAYMAARKEGRRPPPPRADKLVSEYLTAIRCLPNRHEDFPLLVAGKSLGCRVAAMLLGQPELRVSLPAIAGLVCFGYPFHPPKHPEKSRLQTLLDVPIPILVVQGERDEFGNRGEVEAYPLTANITLHWATDGDHSLVPRKRSGATFEGNSTAAAAAVAAFAGQSRKGG